jgi:hypothetical protein
MAGAKPRQGNSRCRYVADHLDRRPCEDNGQPRTKLGTADSTRESELDHRRLQASPPPLHDQPSCIPPQQQLQGVKITCAKHLTKDIRATCGGGARSPGYRFAHPGYKLAQTSAEVERFTASEERPMDTSRRMAKSAAPALVLRDAILRIAPQDEGSESRRNRRIHGRSR